MPNPTWPLSPQQDDLVGNRVVGATPSAWDVVKAMGRAFPLLLGKSIQRAECEGQCEEEVATACMQSWARQVGCLSTLCSTSSNGKISLGMGYSSRYPLLGAAGPCSNRPTRTCRPCPGAWRDRSSSSWALSPRLCRPTRPQPPYEPQPLSRSWLHPCNPFRCGPIRCPPHVPTFSVCYRMCVAPEHFPPIS